MWRSSRPEHLTASALVLDPSGTRVLLTLHKTVNAWLQLGGHCEAGDTTLAGAALREATEESGLTGLEIGPEPLQLSRHQLLAGGCKGAYHLDVQFLVRATAGTEYVVSEESHDLAWFGIEALPDDVDHSVAELAKRAHRQAHSIANCRPQVVCSTHTVAFYEQPGPGSAGAEQESPDDGSPGSVRGVRAGPCRPARTRLKGVRAVVAPPFPDPADLTAPERHRQTGCDDGPLSSPWAPPNPADWRNERDVRR